jgi:ferredoxin
LAFEVTLETPDGPRVIECRPDEFVWNAAARSGVRLPAICHQGRCLTCAGRLVSGDVDQSAADAYFPEDRAAGFILLCTARPLSALRIATGEQWEMRRHRQSLGLPALTPERTRETDSFMSRATGPRSSDRIAIELVEADCEIGFGLVDVAEAESKSGDRESAARVLDDADLVILDIEQRLRRLSERNRTPFGPLLGELRREIQRARRHVPPAS